VEKREIKERKSAFQPFLPIQQIEIEGEIDGGERKTRYTQA
jgi:hypothetical protein